MAIMALLDRLELRRSRPYLLLSIVGSVLTLAVWTGLVGSDVAWPVQATTFVIVHAVLIMVGCLMAPLLAESRPPRYLGCLPLLELPLLLLILLVAVLLGTVTSGRWLPILLTVPAAQVAVLLAGAVAHGVLVPVVRRLSRLLTRRSGRSERQGTVDLLLIATVAGAVMFVAGTMLAGVAPEGTGTRAGLLRAAVQALTDLSGDRQAAAWVGRVGLVLLVLAGAPLVFARRASIP